MRNAVNVHVHGNDHVHVHVNDHVYVHGLRAI
jgi:hypothetical protein